MRACVGDRRRYAVGNKRRRRVLLFDWCSGGHHDPALRWFAEAMIDHVAVCVAAPTRSLANVDGLKVEVVPLGEPRPSIDEDRHWSRAKREVGREEVRLLHAAMRDAQATHALHLFGDGAVRWLVEGPMAPGLVSVLMFRPRSHYPRWYGSHLSTQERVVGLALDLEVARWLRRPDARVALTYDEGAARAWARRGTSRVTWLSEAPVRSIPLGGAAEEKNGYVLAGFMAPRKGLELVAAALEVGRWKGTIRLVGAAAPEFRPALGVLITRLEAAGATVEIFDTWLPDGEYASRIARSACSIVPYPRHIGMSRVLLESAAVGTPVVAHDWGLLGHLVRTHNLGLVVDCQKPREFRRAIERLGDPVFREIFAPSLGRFAAIYSRASFGERLRSVWNDESTP